MHNAFAYCSNLTGTIEINANPYSYDYAFDGTTKAIILTGNSSKLSEIAATSTSGNVTVATNN